MQGEGALRSQLVASGLLLRQGISSYNSKGEASLHFSILSKQTDFIEINNFFLKITASVMSTSADPVSIWQLGL